MCIENQEELDFLARELKEENLKSEYFIGLEEQNGTWTWICNRSIVVTPVKRPWAISEPSGSGPCAKTYFFGNVLVYDDIPCDHKQDYICERRLSSCHKQGWLKTPEIRSLTGAFSFLLQLSPSISLSLSPSLSLSL